MRSALASSEIGLKGLDELQEVLDISASAGISKPIEADFSLARGLNYYTGAIFEVKALDFEIGSICGGGRYDNLTGIFGMPDVSGVGISFGADRIYDVLKNLDKFPKDALQGTQVLFTNMGSAETRYILPIAKALRSAGISCEIYPENRKLGRQFEYADKRKVRFVVVAGANEIAANTINVKNLASGTQTQVPVSEAVEFVCKK